MAFDVLMRPQMTSTTPSLAPKIMTKYQNMSDDQIKSHLTLKISKKIEKTSTKRKQKNAEECIYPLTLEDFRRENDAAKEKKTEKLSTNEGNSYKVD